MTPQICQYENQKLDGLLDFPAKVIACLKLPFHFPAGDRWDLVLAVFALNELTHQAFSVPFSARNPCNATKQSYRESSGDCGNFVLQLQHSG